MRKCLRTWLVFREGKMIQTADRISFLVVPTSYLLIFSFAYNPLRDVQLVPEFENQRISLHD